MSGACRLCLQLSACNCVQASFLKAVGSVNELREHSPMPSQSIECYKPSAAVADGACSSFIHRLNEWGEWSMLQTVLNTGVICNIFKKVDFAFTEELNSVGCAQKRQAEDKGLLLTWHKLLCTVSVCKRLSWKGQDFASSYRSLQQGGSSDITKLIPNLLIVAVRWPCL